MSNKKDLWIAISGWSGCGNTSVSQTLAKELKLNFINYTFRSIAKEEGISLQEVAKKAEISPKYDLKVDETQLVLARQAPTVLGSRLAIWKLKEANLKVFLNAPQELRVSRIQARDGGSMAKVMAETIARDKRDHERYKTLYGIDNHDYHFADLIINTERFNVNQIVAIIKMAALA